MATAKEVVYDALEDILNRSSEEPVESEDGLAGMRYLNDMMTMYAARGINLGYTIVTKLSDVITIPDGAIEGVKAKLSIFLAGKFKVDVPGSVLERVKEGWPAVLNLAVTLKTQNYPSILPVGSGNTPSGNLRYSPFYSEPADGINSETNGPILLEDDTEEDS